MFSQISEFDKVFMATQVKVGDKTLADYFTKDPFNGSKIMLIEESGLAYVNLKKAFPIAGGRVKWLIDVKVPGGMRYINMTKFLYLAPEKSLRAVFERVANLIQARLK